MSKSKTAIGRRVESYWVLIVFFLTVFWALYIYHLSTGNTPDRIFFTIPGLQLEVYWYGICITGGIALGAMVVARLMQQRAEQIFTKQVPGSVRQMQLSVLELPDEIVTQLDRQKITTVGQLLLPWGLDPRMLGLNQAGIEIVADKLEKTKTINSDWIRDTAWRVWNPDHVWNGIAWCLILGVIGARLYHVLTPSPSMAAQGIESPLDYFRNPYQLINLRNGGLGIYGGIAGGVLGLFIYTRRQRLPFIAWADLAAIGMALGQVFGRWGNFFNQELYGRPTDVVWAVHIEPAHRLSTYANVSSFHPAFLYESMWSLLTFFLLIGLYKRARARLLPGDLMALYLIMYAIGRTLLETVRLDSRMVTIGDISVNMAVATLVSLLLAIVMLCWRLYDRWRLTRS